MVYDYESENACKNTALMPTGNALQFNRNSGGAQQDQLSTHGKQQAASLSDHLLSDTEWKLPLSIDAHREMKLLAQGTLHVAIS